MSLSTLRKTYGNGTRHEVLNRAIRAECPNGNQCLDNIAALSSRLKETRQLGDPQSIRRSIERLEVRLSYWQAIRDRLAAQIEAKHNVGPNTNRHPIAASNR